MDADRFDALARTVRSATTRRRALGGMLAGVLGLLGLPAAADRRDARSGRRRSRARTGRQLRAQAIPARCFPGTRCAPGPGVNVSRCDFSATTLANVNCRGCNASNSNFSGVDASGGNFRGANLGGACFVDTNLTGAQLGGAQLGGAIFCRTRMPNGSLDNSGCNKGTACCSTCQPATCQSLGKECGAWPDGCGGTLSCGRCPAGDTPACTHDGTCARCDAVCDCGSCVTFADGNTLCDEGAFGQCGDACASAADCTNPNLPACVVSITNPLTNDTTTLADLCGPPVTVGACAALEPC